MRLPSVATRRRLARAGLVLAVVSGGASFLAPSDVAAQGGRRFREPYFPTVEYGLHDFYFTRAIYSGGRRWNSWAVDFPKADQQFLFVIQRLLRLLDVAKDENAVRLDDPELRRFPFLYALEVGGMNMTEAEVEGLRSYLEAGGFLVIDDFWGDWEWANFEYQIRRVFPDRPIVELPLDHPIFHQFYDIDEILQVPNIGNAIRGVTSEKGGIVPRIFGIFDDDENLMVVVNWNTDLGDAWEWSERPEYPFVYSDFAYQLAINYIIYAYTH